MKKKALSILLAGAMVASLFGCGAYESSDSTSSAAEASGTEEAGSSGETEASGAEEASTGEKVFRYATATEPTNLDPTMGNSVADNEVMIYISEGLVRNNCGTIEPGLAETWEIDDTGTVYTFHLREAYWSDGVQITAQDFVYGMQRFADPATAAPYAWILDGHIKNGGDVISGDMEVSELGVSAPDDMTVVVELEYPQSYFLSLIGSLAQFCPARQDVIEQYGTDYGADASKLMTYGPFTLTNSENLSWTMEKNPDYWNADAINLDRLEMIYVQNSDTQMAMYEQGELDYVNVPTAQVANYPDSDYYMAGSLDWCYINREAEFVNNENLCLALNYALDRNTYNVLANGGAYAAWGNPVMPAVDGVEATYGEEVQPEGYPLDGDTDKAAEYLALAVEELGLSDASEINLEVVITDNENEKKVAEVLQEMWQTTLGITVELRQVTYSEKYNNVCPEGDFQIVYAGWNPDYADPWTYLELFMSDNVYNYSNYANEDFDALMLSAKGMTDPAERLETLAAAEQVLIDTGAVIPLQVRTTHYLIDEDVTGVQFYFSGYNLYAVYADCDPS